MTDWKKDVKDAMWSMFMLNPNPASKDIEYDCEEIKKNIALLIRMTTQKTAGQRKESAGVDWNNLERIQMQIICEATSLALAGYFGDMPKEVE